MAPKAFSEHEMTGTAPEGMATSLLSSQERDRSRTYSILSRPEIRDILRHARLQILGLLSNWRMEPRKVAIHHSRRVAAFHCLLHMIPLGGAITLLVLRWTSYWVGSHPPDPTTLQFVAKFHELLMQVSIVEIAICLVRYEATRGFVPLGALSGAYQATQLSYLWSLDFLSLFTSNAFRGRPWRKTGMLLAIPALLVLTALVGPSSAVLMIPEPGCPRHTAPVAIFMAPNESLYPTYLDTNNGLNMNKASLYPTLQMFTHQAERFRVDDSDLEFPDPSNYERALRLALNRRYRKWPPDRADKWSVEVAMSSIPTSLSYRALGIGNLDQGQMYDANETRSVILPNPVTTVTCATRPDGDESDDIYYVMEDGISPGVLGTIASIADRVNDSFVVGDDTYPDGFRDQLFGPIWLDSPEPRASASIVVLLSWHSNSTELQSLDRLLSEADPLTQRQSLRVMTCSVSAYWNTMQTSITWAKSRPEFAETEPVSELKPRDVRNITMNTTGIDVLRDPEFARILGNTPSIYLAVAFGLTISNIPSLDETTPISGFSVSDRELWGQETDSFDGSSKISERRVVMYAYGYTAHSTSVRLSLTVIMAYCIITVAYFVYILVTGSTSTAWNSAIELVALALQSKRPNYSGRTAVGIDSLDTFNQGVGIRVNSDNELELVFASDRDLDTRGLRKIEKNVAY